MEQVAYKVLHTIFHGHPDHRQYGEVQQEAWQQRHSKVMKASPSANALGWPVLPVANEPFLAIGYPQRIEHTDARAAH